MSKLQAIKSESLAQAVEARDRFLDEHPELKNLQQEIDQRLDGAETDHNRLVMMNELMMDSFLKLDNKLKNLRESRQQADSYQRS